MGHASHQGNHGPVFDDHGGTYSRMGGGAASHISSNPAACPFLSTLPVPPKATAPWTAKHLQVRARMCREGARRVKWRGRLECSRPHAPPDWQFV